MDPTAVRPAATVLALRDGIAGVEVLMVRRNLNSDFVGGAYVFPGGALDPGDSTPAAAARCRGVDDAGASAALGVESGRARLLRGRRARALRGGRRPAGRGRGRGAGRPRRRRAVGVQPRGAKRRRRGLRRDARARGPLPGPRARRLPRPLGHAGRPAAPLRHALLRGPRPGGPARRPRRPRDRGQRVDPPGRRPGRHDARRLRDDLPHDPHARVDRGPGDRRRGPGLRPGPGPGRAPEPRIVERDGAIAILLPGDDGYEGL